MASQYILDRLVDVGDVANDGSGDDLREAFIKLNENILYVGDRIGEAVTGLNLGSGQPIYKSVANAQLSFRSIGAAGNLSVETVNDVITLRFNPNSAVNFNGQDITNVGFNVSGAGPLRLLSGGDSENPNSNYTQLQWTTNLGNPDSGKNSYVWLDTEGVHVSTAEYTGGDPASNYDNQWWFRTTGNLELPGGSSLSVTGSNVDLTAGDQGYAGITSNNGKNAIWADDNGAYIGVNLLTDFKITTFNPDGSVVFPNTISAETIVGQVSGNLTGNVTGLVRSNINNTFVDVNNIENRINTFDYGVINPVFVDPISYYLYAVGTEMGTFNNPSEFGIDAGSINGE